jgi:hypothetical protein
MRFDGRHVFLLVTLEANLPGILEQQGRLGGVVRGMAGGAFAVGGGIMLESGLFDGLLQVFVALEAQLAVRLRKQAFQLGLMRLVTGGAFAVFGRLMLHLGSLKLLLNILVALEAQLPFGLEQQLGLVGEVRIVARAAFAIVCRLVFDLGGLKALLDILMAFEAQFILRLGQQPLEFRPMGQVTGVALAVLDRLVLCFGLGRKRVMTFGTQGGAGQVQHVGIGRSVGIVAAGAFAVFGGLMFDLKGGQEIVVASKADLVCVLQFSPRSARPGTRCSFLSS